MRRAANLHRCLDGRFNCTFSELFNKQKVIKPAFNRDIALFQNFPSGRLARAVWVGIGRWLE